MLNDERSKPKKDAARVRRQGAFSLVELLVVTAIISLLAGFLQPALRQAIDMAGQVQCANQLRQVGQLQLMYSDDHKSTFTGPYRGSKQWVDLLWDPGYLQAIDLVYCPSLDGIGHVELDSQGHPTAAAWSYGVMEAPLYHGGGWTYGIYRYMRGIPPTKVPMLSDSYISTATAKQWRGVSCLCQGAGGRMYCHHNSQANVVFVDGHVSSWFDHEAGSNAWHDLFALTAE